MREAAAVMKNAAVKVHMLVTAAPRRTHSAKKPAKKEHTAKKRAMK